jgi:PST family polysaccharide transporter
MGVGHVASQGLWLASLLALAALVEPSAFGSVATGMVLVNLAGLLVDSGTRGSIVAAPRLGRAEVRGAIALNVGVGLGATVAIAALAGPIVSTFADGGDPGVIRALAAGVVLYAAGITPLALLQKHLRFRAFAGANVAAATLSSAAGIAAGLAGAGVWALVVRQLASMALLTLFAWIAARDLLPPREAGLRMRLRQAGWIGFFVLAFTDFVALNSDFLVVGRLKEATGLGLYALAFTLAFAPLTQVSWQIGRVLFPAAAATSDLATVGRRTLVSLRLLALLLAPLAVPAVVLAPSVLPGLLGPEWKAMVAPFQILLVVGVGHALVGMIGESLSGTGQIGWRARVNAVWAAAMIPALIGLVSADGIRGAALAHAALFVPFAATYVVVGARRLGLSAPRVVAAVAPVLGPVALQLAITVGLAAIARTAGIEGGWAAGIGAACGLLAAGALLASSGALREARGMATAARAA